MVFSRVAPARASFGIACEPYLGFESHPLRSDLLKRSPHHFDCCAFLCQARPVQGGSGSGRWFSKVEATHKHGADDTPDYSDLDRTVALGYLAAAFSDARTALFVSRPSKVPFIENNISLLEFAREKVA
jgi:hypothetical protein